jgi:ketosteroid isomerase-like protein
VLYALTLPPNTPIVTGKEAMRAHQSEAFSRPGFAISWQTTKVEVSRSGDLAYSYGPLQTTVDDAEGNPVTDKGKWVTVWKKQPDGTWKVVIDILNSDGPAAE